MAHKLYFVKEHPSSVENSKSLPPWLLYKRHNCTGVSGRCGVNFVDSGKSNAAAIEMLSRTGCEHYLQYKQNRVTTSDIPWAIALA